jgi:beta-N-acetylhexosaminidase
LNQLPIAERRLLVERSFSELRSLGFHFNLAPVIDLNLNPNNPDIGAIERSYSDRVEDIEINFQILNAVAQKVNLGLSLKHYPGLGGATVNSHLELTDLSDSVSEVQLKLFYDLAKTMVVPSILLSHGMVRQWDTEFPTSISSSAIGRVRHKIPNVLLISDDLQMQALQKKFPTQEACLIGLEAGIDFLLIGNNLMAEDEQSLNYAEAIYQEALKNPKLNEKIQSAKERVLKAKVQWIEPSSQSHHFLSANSSE